MKNKTLHWITEEYISFKTGNWGITIKNSDYTEAASS